MTLEEMDESLKVIIDKVQDCKSLNEAVNCLKQNSQNTGNFLDQKAITRSKKEFDTWLLKLFSKEPIPHKVQGLYFGLFETARRRFFKTEEAFALYVSGSYKWSKTDSDWPTKHEYWPEQRYAKLDILKQIHNMKDTDEYTQYFLTLAISVVYIKLFFEEHNSLQQLNQLKLHISTGFDDGDIYNLFKYPEMTAIK